MKAAHGRDAFNPSVAGTKVMADVLFLGFGLFVGDRIAAILRGFLPGFLARFTPEHLGDIPRPVCC